MKKICKIKNKKLGYWLQNHKMWKTATNLIHCDSVIFSPFWEWFQYRSNWGKNIIGVQWGQGNPNTRVHCSSGKPGFAEFPTGTVDPRIGISRFHCTPLIDSFSHISNKTINLLYIWRDTVVYLGTVKYVTLEVTSDVLKRF